jgi:hypothetical protein
MYETRDRNRRGPRQREKILDEKRKKKNEMK